MSLQSKRQALSYCGCSRWTDWSIAPICFWARPAHMCSVEADAFGHTGCTTRL